MNRIIFYYSVSVGKCSNTRKTSLFPALHILILIVRVHSCPPLPLQNAIPPWGMEREGLRGSYLLEGKRKGAELYLYQLWINCNFHVCTRSELGGYFRSWFGMLEIRIRIIWWRWSYCGRVIIFSHKLLVKRVLLSRIGIFKVTFWFSPITSAFCPPPLLS